MRTERLLVIIIKVLVILTRTVARPEIFYNYTNQLDGIENTCDDMLKENYINA